MLLPPALLDLLLLLEPWGDELKTPNPETDPLVESGDAGSTYRYWNTARTLTRNLRKTSKSGHQPSKRE